MIVAKISNLIKEKLAFEPTKSQEKAMELFTQFIYSGCADSVFVLKGYAGTGKTSLIRALVDALQVFKVNTELMAPTGRAAKVLTQYTNKTSFTIHKRIYRQQATSDGVGRFVLDFNKYSNTLFIVDEASMISNELSEASSFGSGRLLDDLYEYVYSGKNCRLMLVGDTAQLPPVGIANSPALEKSELEGYNLEVYMAELTDVLRQASQSGILFNASKIRSLQTSNLQNDFFPIELNNFQDISRVSGEDLIETIQTCYDKYGEEETIIVTRSNKRANKFNEGIRRTILWRESELAAGDMLMVVKNNYFWVDKESKLEFIANGDIVKVIKVGKMEELYGFRFVNVMLRFIDYDDFEMECKIFLETLTIDGPSFSSEDNRRLFQAVQEDYLDIRNKQKRWEKIRENPYFNALQVKFAYAVTCHKAQGGQWEAVFVDHGYITAEMIDVEFLRWLYTAFTRPKTKLYLVNFDKKFFPAES